jgi:O-antigen/teichoic acid export membrane protein
LTTPAPAAAARLGSRAVLNSLLVLGARVVSRLVALVVVVVLANHLGPAGYGRYTTLVAYSALVSVLADLGLNPLYTREAARDPDRLSAYLATLMSGKVLLGLLGAGVLGLALAAAGLPELVLPGAALLVLTTYSQLLRNTFYALGRLELEVVAILAEIGIQGALIVVGARIGAGVAYFVWAYAAAAAFNTAYCLVVIPLFGLGRPGLRFDPALFRRWLRLALPFALGLFLTNLYFKADVPILQHFKPFREVGWYQFAYKPFEALQFVPLAVQTVVYPVLGVYHRTDRERLGRAYERFFKILVLLGWPLTVGTFVLAHPVGRLFRLFPESEPALRILALAIVFLFANSAFVAMLYSVDRQDLFAWTTAIAVVVNVGLNLLLIPLYGYLAAAATTVVTEAAFSAVGWWFLRPTHRLPWLRLSWRILAAGAVMGLVLLPVSDRTVFLSAPLGAATFAVAAWLLRAVDREEAALFLRGLRPR